MKRAIDCKIESLQASGEDAWIISIPTETVSDAVILLTALLQGRLAQVKFADKSRSAVLCSEADQYVLVLKDTRVAVTKTWVDALTGMLMDVYFNGWSVTSHLDQDFGNVTVTVAVLPPQHRNEP